MYIYSTLTSSVNYSTEVGDVLIHGGANVPDQHLLTPYGKVTEVTDEQYEALKKSHVFQTHVENGFVMADANKVEPEKAAADLTGRDLAAPETAESLLAGEEEVVKVEGGKITKVNK